MKKILLHLAFKFHKNKVAIKLIRPIWRYFENKKIKKRRKSLHKYGIEVLKIIHSCSKSENFQYWLDFGTLLGAYRDKDFIKHDDDMDIAVFYKDRNIIHESLINHGFKIVKRYISENTDYTALEETFFYKGIYIDFFYYHTLGNRMFCNSFSPFDNETIDPSKDAINVLQVKEISLPNDGICDYNFKGITVSVPNNIKNYLTFHYGKNFMIPNADFDYKKEAQNIKYFSKNERLGSVYIM